MSKEQSLVERLRAMSKSGCVYLADHFGCPACLAKGAADRIELLEGMLRLKQDDWIEACKQIDLLERQLAKAIEQRNEWIDHDHLIIAHDAELLAIAKGDK